MSQVYIVVDLGYGDQGKGTTVDYLTRVTGARTIVRYNGGGQAGHNVVTEDGRCHRFSHFGSGMFVPGVNTYLSQHMLISPKFMIKEAEAMATIGIHDALARTYIDHHAIIVTPFHQAANRILECTRGAKRHGSCGLGVGETMQDHLSNPELTIRAGDLFYPASVEAKLKLIREHKRAQLAKTLSAHGENIAPASIASEITAFNDDGVIDFFLKIYADLIERCPVVDDRFWAEILQGPKPIIFEGAQGVLLDETHGFHPYNTWSNTTMANALGMLGGYSGDVIKIGVTRAYSTRHGVGPFVMEDSTMTRRLPEYHNVNNVWQGPMRAGWLDLVMLRYAKAVAGPFDAIAITCLDRVRDLGEIKIGDAYKYDNGTIIHEFAEFATVTKPVVPKIAGAWVALLNKAKPSLREVENIPALITLIEQAAGAPVGILSYGQTAGSKKAAGLLAKHSHWSLLPSP